MRHPLEHREARLELRNVTNGIACFYAKVQDTNCFAALYVFATSGEMTGIVKDWLLQLPDAQRQGIVAELNALIAGGGDELAAQEKERHP